MRRHAEACGGMQTTPKTQGVKPPMARPFKWTPEKEQAFAWMFEGRWTQAQMAQRLGVTRRTVEGWARRQAWRQRIAAVNAERWAQTRATWQVKAQRQAEAHLRRV